MISVETQWPAGCHPVNSASAGCSIWQARKLRPREATSSGCIAQHRWQIEGCPVFRFWILPQISNNIKYKVANLLINSHVNECEVNEPRAGAPDREFIKHFHIIITFYSYNNPVGRKAIIVTTTTTSWFLFQRWGNWGSKHCTLCHLLPSNSITSVCCHIWLTSSVMQNLLSLVFHTWAADLPITPAWMGPSSHPTTQNNGDQCQHMTPAWSQPEQNKTLPTHLKRRLWWCYLLSHRRSFVGKGRDCSQVTEEKE